MQLFLQAYFKRTSSDSSSDLRAFALSCRNIRLSVPGRMDFLSHCAILTAPGSPETIFFQPVLPEKNFFHFPEETGHLVR